MSFFDVASTALGPDLCLPRSRGLPRESRLRARRSCGEGLPPAWEVQNEHVGWGCVANAADAANGSWAGTKQSDADRPMWGARADARQIVRIQTERYLRGGTSTTRHVRWTKSCPSAASAALNNKKRLIHAENTRSDTKRSAALLFIIALVFCPIFGWFKYAAGDLLATGLSVGPQRGAA